MKRALSLLALTGLVVSLSACAVPPRIQWVHTGRVLPPSPGVIAPLYVINGVALQQYSPKLYTPFVYDHRGLDDNTFYHAQAIRHSAPRGSVYVGPLTVQATGKPSPPPLYEVRRATPVTH
ncbi:hypothetical protein [Prosthecobacter sp.]|uniref:hypothetical protein n=1 Tax=Prosthecobacter sp. TaxID=1965333 RepID=UPI0037847BAC